MLLNLRITSGNDLKTKLPQYSAKTMSSSLWTTEANGYLTFCVSVAFLYSVIFCFFNCDFREKEVLYLINEKPKRLQTVVQSYSSKPYRYVRYVGPKDSHCNIAEAAFYTPNDTTLLKGKVIGTPGCFQKDGSHEYTNVFDGDVTTSFDYIEPSGGWSGLDLGTPKQIGRIVYTPRSYDNYIRSGDEYELFYCVNKTGWFSLGIQLSGSDSLVYRKVPANVMFLLKNYSRGRQERIFVYEDGKQRWK